MTAFQHGQGLPHGHFPVSAASGRRQTLQRCPVRKRLRGISTSPLTISGGIGEWVRREGPPRGVPANRPGIRRPRHPEGAPARGPWRAAPRRVRPNMGQVGLPEPMGTAQFQGLVPPRRSKGEGAVAGGQQPPADSCSSPPAPPVPGCGTPLPAPFARRPSGMCSSWARRMAPRMSSLQLLRHHAPEPQFAGQEPVPGSQDQHHQELEGAIQHDGAPHPRSPARRRDTDRPARW